MWEDKMSGGMKGKKKIGKPKKKEKKEKKSDVLSMLSVSEMLMAYELYCPLAISACLFFQNKKTELNNPSLVPFFHSRVQVTWTPEIWYVICTCIT